LKPAVLKTCQDAVVRAHGERARFYFVFHGGSGSTLEEIHEAVDYGVVKMNVDTDMQYAFSRAIADHVLKHYDGLLKVDGEVGNKKSYDPRTYLSLAEAAMATRVRQAVSDLRATGTTLYDPAGKGNDAARTGLPGAAPGRVHDPLAARRDTVRSRV
jgi:fructose-bisphosphate aldolase class II